MKKALSLFLAVVLTLGIFCSVPFTELPFKLTAAAASASDLTFSLNSDGKSYCVSDCDEFASGALEIPSTYNGLPVTAILSYMVTDCDRLTSITIPDSVTSIGDPDTNYNAFEGCSKLTAINVSSGNSEYTSVDGVLFNKNKTELVRYPEGKTDSSYTIPNSVTSIGYSAFSGCTNLKSVTIPDSVKSIDINAFDNCTGLTSITIPDSVTSMGDYAFEGCRSLTSVTISNSLTSIGFSAFMNCTVLKSVIIGDSVTSISNTAFCNCVSLTSVTIPDSVTSIDDYAFYGCTSLISVTIPDSVTSIGNCAFYGCTSLTSVTIPDSVIGIGIKTFGYTDDGGKISDFTISGKIGSAAEEYANDNGFEFISLTKTGHTSSDWIIDTAATASAAGSRHKECTVCGAVLETSEIPQLKPSTPNLGTPSNTSTGVKVSWGKVDGADTYTVYRKDGNGSYKAIASGLTTTSYIDTTAKSGTTYTYTVRATNIAGTGGYDKTGKSITYIAMPKPSVANGNGGVTVKWSKVTGAKGYYVYRKTGNGSWSRIANVTTTSYTDKSAKSGTTYKYTVKAYNGKTVSAYNTSGVSIKYLAMPKLSGVTNVSGGVTVKWSKVTGAKGYYVYRKSGNSGWKKIADVTGASYTDKSAKSGTTYTYTVKAYSGKTASAHNTTGLSIKYLAMPKLTGVSSAKAGVTVKWNKVTGANGYYVYRKTGNGSWSKIATVSGNSKVSYLDKTAKKGTTYTYTVKAYSGKTVSAHNTTGLKIKDKY